MNKIQAITAIGMNLDESLIVVCNTRDECEEILENVRSSFGVDYGSNLKVQRGANYLILEKVHFHDTELLVKNADRIKGLRSDNLIFMDDVNMLDILGLVAACQMKGVGILG